MFVYMCRFGFVEVNYVHVFQEYEYRLTITDSILASLQTSFPYQIQPYFNGIDDNF